MIDNRGSSGMGLIKHGYRVYPADSYLRIYFYLTTLPATGQSFSLAELIALSGDDDQGYYRSGGGVEVHYVNSSHCKLGVAAYTSAGWQTPIFSSTPELVTANSWHCIEIRVYVGGTQLWLDGEKETFNPSASSYGNGLNTVNMGCFRKAGGYAPNKLYIDEFVVSSEYIGEATADFPDLGLDLYNRPALYDFNDKASSLSVAGTVTLYSSINYAGSSISLSDTIVDLTDYGWNDIASSLIVQGTVTLNEHIDCGGKSVTFTSKTIPYDNLGTEWNINSNLVKNQGGWDCRSHNWVIDDHGYRGCDEYPSIPLRMMDWVSDGRAHGYSYDNLDEWWRVSDIVQGFDTPLLGANNLGLYPKSGFPIMNWFGCISSLKVIGNVTVFDLPNMEGNNRTYTEDDTDLSGEGWDNRPWSMVVYGKVTFYENINYGGASITFDCNASYQPSPLSVGNQGSITLEGIVSNPSNNIPFAILPNGAFTGAKFDVWAVGGGKALMMELYINRGGANLWWPDLEQRCWIRQDSESSMNILMALDAFPEYASRTAYSNGYVKWNVDILGIINFAKNHWPELDVNALQIPKIGFAVEAASNPPLLTPVTMNYDCNRLRLCHSSPASPYWVQGINSYSADNYGVVIKPNNIVGAAPDNQESILAGVSTGDTAKIIGIMNSPQAHGDVYVRCHSIISSNLYVFVSNNLQPGSWTQLCTVSVSQMSPTWIYCGSTANNFKYLSIGCYNGGNDFMLVVDAVRVVS